MTRLDLAMAYRSSLDVYRALACLLVSSGFVTPR
jgi:hypothetical protein